MKNIKKLGILSIIMLLSISPIILANGRVTSDNSPPTTPEIEGPKKAKDNSPPTTPEIEGPKKAKAGEICTYSFNSTDPDGDQIIYCVNWYSSICCMCQHTIEYGPFDSGYKHSADFQWPENLESRKYHFIVWAKDDSESQNNESEPIYFNVEISGKDDEQPDDSPFIIKLKGFFNTIYQLINNVLPLNYYILY